MSKYGSQVALQMGREMDVDYSSILSEDEEEWLRRQQTELEARSDNHKFSRSHTN